MISRGRAGEGGLEITKLAFLSGSKPPSRTSHRPPGCSLRFVCIVCVLDELKGKRGITRQFTQGLSNETKMVDGATTLYAHLLSLSHAVRPTRRYCVRGFVCDIEAPNLISPQLPSRSIIVANATSRHAHNNEDLFFHLTASLLLGSGERFIC